MSGLLWGGIAVFLGLLVLIFVHVCEWYETNFCYLTENQYRSLSQMAERSLEVHNYLDGLGREMDDLRLYHYNKANDYCHRIRKNANGFTPSHSKEC